MSTAAAVDPLTVGVAIPIPHPFGAQLQEWRQALGDPLASAIPPHITLLPPTRLRRPQLAEVSEHLADVAAVSESFRVRLSGAGTFRPVSPVVFVALADGISGCEMLSKAVCTGPFPVELTYPYHPHVTVAHDLSADVLDRAFRELADYSADFDVTAFSLYEHGLDCVWRPCRSFPLGDSSHATPDSSTLHEEDT